MTILIRFKDSEVEREALGCLAVAGVPLKTWRNGETAIPEEAVGLLASKSLPFEVIGRATYEQITPIRDLASQAV